jgi:hypothetical protein
LLSPYGMDGENETDQQGEKYRLFHCMCSDLSPDYRTAYLV